MENEVKLSGAFSEGYGIIPKKLMRSQTVSVYAKVVVAYMMSYTGAGNSCFPGIETMAEDLQISKSTVIRSIKELCDNKWIVKERMYPHDPLKHNNKYILTCISEVSEADNRGVRRKPTRCQETTSEVSEADKNNNIINNNSINNNTSELQKTEDSVLSERMKSLLPKYHDIYSNLLKKYNFYDKNLYPAKAIAPAFKQIIKAGYTDEQFSCAVNNYEQSDFWKGQGYPFAGLCGKHFTAWLNKLPTTPKNQYESDYTNYKPEER